MKDTLLSTWYQLLSQASGRPVRSTRDISRLVDENREPLQRLWSAYNSERGDLGRLPLSTKPYLIAYILGFHLNNQHRGTQIIQRALGRVDGLANAASQWTLMDLGCGSGALAMAMVEALTEAGVSPEHLSLELIDQSRPLLNAARSAAGIHLPPDRVRSLSAPLGDIKTRQVFDKILAASDEGHGIWVGMSYVLNEIVASPRALRFMESVADRLKESVSPGVFILLEAGREKEARLAQEMRENFFQEGFYPLYPCPDFISCPMLEPKERRNWCYSEVSDPAIKEASPVSRTLRLHRRKLATGGYVFLNPALMKRLQKPLEKRGAREVMVGFPEVRPHVHHALVCSRDGLKRVERFPAQALRGEPL